MYPESVSIFSELPMGVQIGLPIAAMAFGLYCLCDAFSGGLSRFSAPPALGIFGGLAGVMFGLYFGLPLILPTGHP